jgi:hypothetical protein
MFPTAALTGSLRNGEAVTDKLQLWYTLIRSRQQGGFCRLLSSNSGLLKFLYKTWRERYAAAVFATSSQFLTL